MTLRTRVVLDDFKPQMADAIFQDTGAFVQPLAELLAGVREARQLGADLVPAPLFRELLLELTALFPESGLHEPEAGEVEPASAVVTAPLTMSGGGTLKGSFTRATEIRSIAAVGRDGKPTLQGLVLEVLREAAGQALTVAEVLDGIRVKGWSTNKDNPQNHVSTALSAVKHKVGNVHSPKRGLYAYTPGLLENIGDAVATLGEELPTSTAVPPNPLQVAQTAPAGPSKPDADTAWGITLPEKGTGDESDEVEVAPTVS